MKHFTNIGVKVNVERVKRKAQNLQGKKVIDYEPTYWKNNNTYLIS